MAHFTARTIHKPIVCFAVARVTTTTVFKVPTICTATSHFASSALSHLLETGGLDTVTLETLAALFVSIHALDTKVSIAFNAASTIPTALTKDAVLGTLEDTAQLSTIVAHRRLVTAVARFRANAVLAPLILAFGTLSKVTTRSLVAIATSTGRTCCKNVAVLTILFGT